MSLEIQVAHDILCPWCWIALSQARRLEMSYPVSVRWIGYELFPEGLDWPAPSDSAPEPENKPRTLTRVQFAAMLEGIKFPKVERPHHMRIHNALEALEFASDAGFGREAVGRLYEAYWREGRAVNEPDVICDALRPWLADEEGLRAALDERRFADRIVPFDDEANARGVYNVPTFFIGEERLAEMPYSTLALAVEKALK
jgi:predicted DsbA family dithiol-disulfide isomerase